MGNYQNTRHHKGPRELTTGGEWIYGRNPVIEALRAGRRTFTEIILPPGSKDEADEIASLRLTAQQRHIMIRTADRERLDHLVHGGHHQGVALKASGYPYVDLEDIVQEVEEDENAIVVALDHLEDPQNLGSILRIEKPSISIFGTGEVVVLHRLNSDQFVRSEFWSLPDALEFRVREMVQDPETASTARVREMYREGGVKPKENPWWKFW